VLEAAAVYASDEIFELFFYGKPNVAEKDDNDTNHSERNSLITSIRTWKL